MTLLEELAQADVPGAKIRLALMRRGSAAERERIINIMDELLGDHIAVCRENDITDYQLGFGDGVHEAMRRVLGVPE